jgi:hypothetical protein
LLPQARKSSIGSRSVSVGEALVAPNTGGLRLSEGLDFDQSPGTDVGGSPALVYNSDTVSVRPIIAATLTTDPTKALPASIQAQLTWNGTAQPWVTFGTTGHSPGDTYLLAVQVANAVSATGLYTYTLEVKTTGTTPTYDVTTSGTQQVVANDSSPFGAGWYLDGLDRLVPVSNGTATAMLWVNGTGDSRLFNFSNGAFTSPADDFGTLAANGPGYTYIAKDQTKRNFSGAGLLTGAVDTHGVALTYAYDAYSRLT